MASNYSQDSILKTVEHLEKTIENMKKEVEKIKTGLISKSKYKKYIGEVRGILKKVSIDPLAYQKEIREEWKI